MTRIFAAWGKRDAVVPHALVGGEEQPAFVNGSPDMDCERLFWRIEAANWEEAMVIYHLRLGREPYKPVLPAARCPKCDALFYPHGSGQCWNCDYAN